jgi:hypothetical protein
MSSAKGIPLSSSPLNKRITIKTMDWFWAYGCAVMSCKASAETLTATASDPTKEANVSMPVLLPKVANGTSIAIVATAPYGPSEQVALRYPSKHSHATSVKLI